MIRIDHLLLGYVRFRIEKNDISKAAECFLKANVSVAIDENGTFTSSLLNAKNFKSALDNKVDYEVSAPRGLGGMLLGLRSRFGLMAAILVSVLLFLYSGGLVWDIRIEGVSEELIETLKEELSNSGLYIGADWDRINKSRVEAGVLSTSDTVSWLNINRRGCVAYISAVEKVVHSEKESPKGYANIVAERDCIIEDIIVRSGVSVVKVGQSVKKGDLLISGIIPTELGGGFCYADGDIKGRYSDSISVVISRQKEDKVYTDEYVKNVKLNIFNFSINIFKRYRNLSTKCDIIEEKSEFLLDEDKTMPFSINKTVIREYITEIRELSTAEMSDSASALLRERLREFLSDKDLLGIKTNGKFGNGEYRLSADMVLCGNVAKISSFEFESETK